MVDILEHLQDKYVPMAEKLNKNGEKEKVPISTTFFGGDQLTEERARNVQLARSDGADTLERLQGVWPKNEDWHAIRTAYKVSVTWTYKMKHEWDLSKISLDRKVKCFIKLLQKSVMYVYFYRQLKPKCVVNIEHCGLTF